MQESPTAQERRTYDHRAARFREGLEQGKYRALFDDYLARVIAESAPERGLVDEIGAPRLVLARLLIEEEDAAVLAANVARVALVAVQAAHAQRAISGEVAQRLTEALTYILIELDGADTDSALGFNALSDASLAALLGDPELMQTYDDARALSPEGQRKVTAFIQQMRSRQD